MEAFLLGEHDKSFTFMLNNQISPDSNKRI